jgi:hypothetical protein
MPTDCKRKLLPPYLFHICTLLVTSLVTTAIPSHVQHVFNSLVNIYSLIDLIPCSQLSRPLHFARPPSPPLLSLKTSTPRLQLEGHPIRCTITMPSLHFTSHFTSPLTSLHLSLHLSLHFTSLITSPLTSLHLSLHISLYFTSHFTSPLTSLHLSLHFSLHFSLRFTSPLTSFVSWLRLLSRLIHVRTSLPSTRPYGQHVFAQP